MASVQLPFACDFRPYFTIYDTDFRTLCGYSGATAQDPAQLLAGAPPASSSSSFSSSAPFAFLESLAPTSAPLPLTPSMVAPATAAEAPASLERVRHPGAVPAPPRAVSDQKGRPASTSGSATVRPRPSEHATACSLGTFYSFAPHSQSECLPSAIIGATNPFFHRALKHWPHILYVGHWDASVDTLQ